MIEPTVFPKTALTASGGLTAVRSSLSILITLFTAGAASGPPASAADQAPPSSQPRTGEQVYRQTCGYCHGRNVGPVILGRHLAAELIRERARNGLNGMPAFRPSEISPEELAAVVSYVQTSGANPNEGGQ